MRGLYHAFGGDEGPPRPAYGWMFAGVSLSFLGIEDNPMYALLIQQPRLVRLLEKRARDRGVDIRWGHELTAMRAGDDNVALTVATPGRSYRMDAGYLVGADGGRSTVRKAVGIGFPGHTSPIVSRIAHVYLPEELLVPGRGYEIPGFGLLPFGHNRFEDGTVIAFPLEPTRPMLGSIEYGWTVGSAEGPMTLGATRQPPPHHRRRRTGGGAERAGPACAAQARRDELAPGRAVPGRPGATASVTPRMCIPRWADQV